MEVESSLSGSKFLMGEQPGLLDFSLYHCLWFIKFVGRQRLDIDVPLIESWYLAMTEFSTKAAGELSIEESIVIAREGKPRALPSDMQGGLKLGELVSVSTSDYRQYPVLGQLVGEDEYSWVLKRELETKEVVHVHFPKLGYQLTARD